MKNTLRLIAILTLVLVVEPVIAQTETPKKETSNAKVVIINGQKRLVLKDQIELIVDVKIWNALDSLTTAPWGGKGVQLKDVKGYNVLAQKGRINGEVGLMFTSGTTCVAVTKNVFQGLNNLP